MIVFVAQARDAATVDAWDAGDPGAGYGCYGGPERDRVDRHRGSLSRRLGAWIRGRGPAGRDRPARRGRLAPHRPDPLQPRVDRAAARPLRRRAQGRRLGREAGGQRAGRQPGLAHLAAVVPHPGPEARHSLVGRRPAAVLAVPRLGRRPEPGLHDPLGAAAHAPPRASAARSRSSARRASARCCSRSAAGSSTGSGTTGSPCRCGSTTATGSRSDASTGTGLGARSRGARTRPTRCASASCTSRSSRPISTD